MKMRPSSTTHPIAGWIRMGLSLIGVWSGLGILDETVAQSQLTGNTVPGALVVGGGILVGDADGQPDKVEVKSGDVWLRLNSSGITKFRLGEMNSQTGRSAVDLWVSDNGGWTQTRIHSYRWGAQNIFEREGPNSNSRVMAVFQGEDINPSNPDPAVLGNTVSLFNAITGNSDPKLRLVSNGKSYFCGGNLGIGFQSPESKLEVDGNLRVEGKASMSKGVRTIPGGNILMGEYTEGPFPDDRGFIDLLASAVHENQADLRFDLTHDRRVDQADLNYLIRDLFQSEFGDANLDGAVDILDYGILAGNFNGEGSWADGDFNGDGWVDILDFSIMAGNFNWRRLNP